MATTKHATTHDDAPVAADIPLDDPASIAPDEGDIGSAPPPGKQAHALAPASLSGSELAEIRNLTLRAAELALAHRGAVHYSQDAGRRWEGISRKLHARDGQFPSYADCSSFVTWCLWNGMSAYGLPDTVNGQNWTAGYTGTELTHGTRVTSESQVLPCDLALYGNGGTGKHVAICIGGGLVISHGSEAGPYKLKLHYRSDLMQIRRYVGAGSPGPGPGPGPGTLVVDGVFGPATVKKMQSVLGVAADGQFGPTTKKALQSHLGVAADGQIGPATIRALQAHVGAAVDGQWGHDTTAALQRQLNAGKF